MSGTDLFSLFLPLFVAIDPPGVLPAFMQITGGLSELKRRKVLLLSVLTAGAVGLSFIPIGPWVLGVLGLKTGDFQVAGGLLILAVALKDIVWNQKWIFPGGNPAAGIVPIGIPLLVGPAVLTTLILLQQRFADGWIAFSLVANLGVAWAIFAYSSRIMKWMGPSGVMVVSKLAALLLSAYAVMMIRVGLTSFK